MTDELRLPAVAARLVAWHNRHPLACRIAVSHVHGIGYLALPFVAGGKGAPAAAAAAAPPGAAATATPAGGSLRERAQARAREPGAAAPHAAATGAAPAAGQRTAAADLAALQSDFSEDLVDPLRPRAVARFAARAGQVLAQAPGDGPLRQARADGAHPGRATVMVYVLTAVIETGTHKTRVLLGSGAAAPVLGRRIFSTPRLAAVAALAALVVGGPTWWLQRAPAAPAPHAVAAAPAAAAPASASAPAAAADTAAAGNAAADTAARETAPSENAARESVAAPRAAVESAAAASAATGRAAVDSAAAERVGVDGAAAERVAAGRVATARAASASVDAEAAAAKAAARTPAASAGVAAVPAVGASAAVPPSPTAPAAPAGDAPVPGAAAPTAGLGAAGVQAPAPAASVARSSAFRALGKRPGAPADIRPLISEEDKARARQARADLRRPAAAVPPRPLPGRAAPPAPGQPPSPVQEGPRPAAAPTAEPAFALTTRALRTRAEADLVLVAMRSLLHTVGAGEVKVEVLAQGDDWRVVGWPFARRADADKARALLVSRGMRVEVVGF